MRKLWLVWLLVAPFGLARAQSFSTTNLQLLYGTGFDDWYVGNHTTESRLATLTLEHFTAFATGDVFFFTDLTRGEFTDASGTAIGQDHRAYAEAAVRVSPFRLFGRPLTAPGSRAFVRDVLVAGQVNVDGNGFAAYMVGAGVDLTVPGFAVANVNAYVRDDTFNEPTFQVTAVWNVPLPLGVRAWFEGFVDVSGTDNDGVDVMTQPQLLIHPQGSPFAFGAELYVHTNEALTVVAPQVLLKWIF